MSTGYLYDLARHIAPITGLNGTYCGSGDGLTVSAMPQSLPDTPAAVVLDGEHEVIRGYPERWQLSPEVHIYVSQSEGLGASYERARSFKALVLARCRESITSTEIDDMGLVSFRAIEDQVWPVDSARHYFVLPCVFTGRVNKSVTYLPPTRV